MAAVTIQDIKKKAKKANDVFFNNRIDLSVIQFKTSSRMTRTLGVFKVRNGKQSITLSTLLFDQKEEWMTTLVHELVHAWQWQTGKPLDHGWSFKQMARQIYSIDPEVIITRTRTSDYIEKAVASRYQEFNRKQFAVRQGDKVWFLRSISGAVLTSLRARGYKVSEASAPIVGVRHCKNAKALINARYYYAQSVVERWTSESNITWKEF